MIREVINKITDLDRDLMQETQGRLDNLTKPQGSLGRLEEIARLITGITGKENPELKNKVIFTFAADHGITDEKVSAYPREVTAQMVYNFLNGGAGINVLAKHIGARVVVADLGVAEKINLPSPAEAQSAKAGFGGLSAFTKVSADKNFKDRKIGYGTKNMARGPAMTKEEAAKAIETGIEIFEEELNKGIDIAGTGDMGIGNTTAASAITACLTKKAIAEVTGKGTGIDEKALKNKVLLIKKALELNRPDPKEALDVLAKVGGFEIGGLTGVILAAAANKIPVVIDGFISGAAALIAYHLEPKSKSYMLASHRSVEKGHKIILKHIGLKPMLELNLRLGEGTGAALGINIAEAAVKILTQMATFKSASVSEKLAKEGTVPLELI